MIRHHAAPALAALLLAAALVRADEPHSPPRPPEAAEMFVSILARGAEMGPGTAWFHPGRSRYGWDWLTARYDPNGDGTITAEEFTGPKPLFARLDRDRDGSLRRDDLDWTEQSLYLRSRAPFRPKFAAADSNSNGRVTREEFQALFDRAAGAKGYLTPDDLADLLGPPPRSSAGAGGPPRDMPTRSTLLKGLVSGEIGSIHEGPGIDQAAPDFTLSSHDRQLRLSLSDFQGRQPVVLIFGSFT